MKCKPHQQTVIAFILLIGIVNSLTGCKYYKPVVAAPAYNDSTRHSALKELNEEGKYFILRKGTHNYSLHNVVLDDTKMTLTAKADTIQFDHKLYLQHKKKRYSYGNNNNSVLREVHIYTFDTSRVDTSVTYTFPLSDVLKIEIIKHDKRRSTTGTATGIAITAAVTTLVVLAITADNDPPPQPDPQGSCPYISTYDGKNYNLQGEIYSASIYQTLQKDDYLPMKIGSATGDYKIRISNELQEIQHTDFADLVVVEHDKNVQMLVNPNGELFSISNPQAPATAMVNNNIDVRTELLNRDNIHCFFKDDYGTRAAEDLYISFNNDSKSKRGKLILSAKTSGWVNYLFGEFAKGFGNYYAKWARQQEKRPAAELEQWTEDQNIPLTVSVKTKEGWKVVQKLKVVGPILNRDMVIPVELPGDDPAEFKISCGYLFWELDYAAIDYTPDDVFTVDIVKPREAIDENGVNVLPVVAHPDGQYLVQPNIGNTATLTYNRIVPKDGMMQTFFLHSSGYYTHIRHYTGSPKSAFLKRFEQPGALSAFSRQKFAEGLGSTASK